MNKLKSSSIVLVAVIVLFSTANINLDYRNCMKATKHSYISKEGAAHIASQCNAFIRNKLYVK
jgi:hypothetical protein